MPNDCNNAVQLIGDNALKAFNEIANETPKEFYNSGSIRLNYVSFDIYSRWRCDTKMWIDISKKYNIAVINNFEIEYGLEGYGLFVCEDGVQKIFVEYDLKHSTDQIN